MRFSVLRISLVFLFSFGAHINSAVAEYSCSFHSGMTIGRSVELYKAGVLDGPKFQLSKNQILAISNDQNELCSLYSHVTNNTNYAVDRDRGELGFFLYSAFKNYKQVFGDNVDSIAKIRAPLEEVVNAFEGLRMDRIETYIPGLKAIESRCKAIVASNAPQLNPQELQLTVDGLNFIIEQHKRAYIENRHNLKEILERFERAYGQVIQKCIVEER